jgi:hypothetical protein
MVAVRTAWGRAMALTAPATWAAGAMHGSSSVPLNTGCSPAERCHVRYVRVTIQAVGVTHMLALGSARLQHM